MTNRQLSLFEDARLRIDDAIALSLASLAEYGQRYRHGMQTWRMRLPGLTAEQDANVRQASKVNRRAQEYRARRAQTTMDL